ncbi:TraR/DksA C4-type zinc finger protein [Pelagibacterium halotolerans]|uniref:Zinc finger DksA/TraR C4-type domain-containing protein n=1 Tax=Pelagibacterium halotolerans (strain DSM 22347 / JCM 15775 / CGMCC 1.7692 / B2) TaxID=1082931 RepID=G4RDE1_PELHB|nr:TraR/DksA C4-type zinc finger protein [Pelagibacterium halotolerans]AEQ50767.1 hypothetical protein KKY_728 [Pelagibacterium halotolerans B2]QJR19315.1 TraR/DksA family transcriptional regulator [Pelagibacterium halotolerans]SDZ95303.1 transcriptional regulator, TraR/DksA family [Pelagibacterium halotolerans]
MHFSNRDYDLAEARSEQERAAGIKAAQAALCGEGVQACVDCLDPIPEARRKAVPSAKRCAGCQTKRERGR